MANEGGTVKVVVVGDGTTGKTCLLVRFADGEYSEEYKVWSRQNSSHLLLRLLLRPSLTVTLCFGSDIKSQGQGQ